MHKKKSFERHFSEVVDSAFNLWINKTLRHFHLYRYFLCQILRYDLLLCKCWKVPHAQMLNVNSKLKESVNIKGLVAVP